ncbi:type IV pilus secretin PilQ [Fibrobacterota bacterium]
MKHRDVLKRIILTLFLMGGLLSGQDQSEPPSGQNPDNTNQPGPAASSQNVARDFYFPNLDIRSAFKAISAAGKVDIVLSPTLSGRLNLTLTAKTWKQALEVLCQMYGLTYSIEDEYIYVQSLKEFNSQEKEAQLIREIIHLKHTKVEDLQTAVTGLLSERGKLAIVEMSNAFIITDIQSKLGEIKKAIINLDVETYQVHIQAQIIEASSDAAQELGINWGYGTGAPAPDLNDVPSASQSGAVLGRSSPGRVANPTLAVAARLLDGRLGASIEHLLSEGKGEVVAKPQITTLDNTEARIFIGERRPFNKLDANLNSTTEFVDAGIELIVTPHITNDNRVILDLSPQRSEARTDAITRGPIVTTTEAKTTVVVNDGETVVIGGLTSKVENETERGIPFLKDIPLLGILFKHTSKNIVKKDLIIFITPYIVKNGQAQPRTAAIPLRMISDMEEARSAEENLESPRHDPPDEIQEEEISDEKVGDFLNEIGGEAQYE